MSFISPYNNPKVMLLSDRSDFPWITIEELIYESELTGDTYTVPKHFRTDFASIPKALVLVPIAGPLLFQRYFGNGVWYGVREAILHDYLRRGPNPPVAAHIAHKVFREALQDAGYPDDLVANYYAAVSTFNS